MTPTQIKTAISKMDHTSNEFADIVQFASERYFTFGEDATQFQKAGALLNQILHKGEENELVVLVNLFGATMDVINGKQSANVAQFGMTDNEGKDQILYVSIYTDPKALDKLMTNMLDVVTEKAREQAEENGQPI